MLYVADLNVKSFAEEEESYCHLVNDYKPAATRTLAEFDFVDEDKSVASSIDSSKGGKRPAEEEMKDKAFGRSLRDISQLFKCKSTCVLGQKCMSKVGVVSSYLELEWFWGGDIYTPAITTGERREKVIIKMKQSLHKDNKTLDPFFQFKVADAIICEYAYLNVIGMSYTRMWKSCKKELFRLATGTDINTLSQIDIDEIDKMIQLNKAPSERRARTKYNHAQTFIEYFRQCYSSLSPNPGEENLRILPYETISQLFEEYLNTNKVESVHPDLRAARTTFREAWADMYKGGSVKFTRGKGTFPTCDICNNCNDLLHTAKSIKWTKKQRDIIFSFKTMHLKQQAAERTALDALKKIARESCDDAGQPKLAVFLGDGMTIYACQTPKYSRSRISKGDTHFFQNRTFGVEVHCYGVSGKLLCHCFFVLD